MLSVFKFQFGWTVVRRTGESNPSGCKQPSNASQACPVPTPGVSSEAAPATRWLYQTFRMDLCDIHHNHQIPFLIWEADKCLVVNADGRAREIAPLSFLRESRFSRGVKIPTLRKPRRAGQPDLAYLSMISCSNSELTISRISWRFSATCCACCLPPMILSRTASPLAVKPSMAA